MVVDATVTVTIQPSHPGVVTSVVQDRPSPCPAGLAGKPCSARPAVGSVKARTSTSVPGIRVHT